MTLGVRSGYSSHHKSVGTSAESPSRGGSFFAAPSSFGEASSPHNNVTSSTCLSSSTEERKGKTSLLCPRDHILLRTASEPHSQRGEQRRTHIEVCARLRPLLMTEDESSGEATCSNSSFIDQKQFQLHHPLHNNASLSISSSSRILPRKPQLPRIPSATATTNATNQNLTAAPHHSPPPRAGSFQPANNQIYAWNIVSGDTITQSFHTDIVPGRTHRYTLDRVYGPDVTNRQLYEGSVRSLVHAALEGYHTSVLAYGQTSTGKTHTMMGTNHQPGIIPSAIRECFSRIRHSKDRQPREYLLRVSYLEVYKEHIRDLLVPNNYGQKSGGNGGGGSLFNATAAVPIRLFDSADGLVIKGLVEEVVTTPEQVFRLLAQGEARRQVGATHLNLHSSRSHTIFRLWIESRSTARPAAISPDHRGRGVGGGRGAVRLSSLSLVDLAGSESVRLTGSTERQQEGHFINKSLMTLGKVVYALSEGVDYSKHVPYRDSKLTRLLQQSLSGSAQVVLICCISPLVSHLDESHNTFKFACRAKKIPQHAVIQEATDEKTLLQSYRDEIEELKRQLREAQEEQARLLLIQKSAPPSSPSSLSSFSAPSAAAQPLLPPYCDVDEDEISELVKSIQTMERLILKTRPLSRSNSSALSRISTASSAAAPRPEDLLDVDMDDDRDEEENLLALASDLGQSSILRTPPRKSFNERTDSHVLITTTHAAAAAAWDEDQDLHAELSRIQGLLGSVLRKRSSGAVLPRGSGTSVPLSPASHSNEEEVRNLRAQLEMQEVASSFRKADASFLQKQLEEKDELLQEVSKILEVVEERQIRLEEENATLRREVAVLRAQKR